MQRVSHQGIASERRVALHCCTVCKPASEACPARCRGGQLCVVRGYASRAWALQGMRETGQKRHGCFQYGPASRAPASGLAGTQGQLVGDHASGAYRQCKAWMHKTIASVPLETNMYMEQATTAKRGCTTARHRSANLMAVGMHPESPHWEGGWRHDLCMRL
jgi:hypothetical protein